MNLPCSWRKMTVLRRFQSNWRTSAHGSRSRSELSADSYQDSLGKKGYALFSTSASSNVSEGKETGKQIENGLIFKGPSEERGADMAILRTMANGLATFSAANSTLLALFVSPAAILVGYGIARAGAWAFNVVGVVFVVEGLVVVVDDGVQVGEVGAFWIGLEILDDEDWEVLLICGGHVSSSESSHKCC
ncbi:hypothetical protein Syun_030889 [Stephania yunnanensis]|uniref:Uncharacterized protein n=1 Tax=Stephania yunnanensis TaxID=152371 RepID=A0AAP0DV88_9MAGN